MMTLYRLVHLIETHSHELASCLLNRVRSSDATPDYYLVSDEDLKDRVYEIYRHLGDWLINRDEFDLEQRYEKIGAGGPTKMFLLARSRGPSFSPKTICGSFSSCTQKWNVRSKFLVNWKCFKC